MSDDIDHQPASEDPNVQAFLDTKWREAIRAAREGMESLRDIIPELFIHLPETAQNHLLLALTDMTDACRELHEAGVEIIGQDAYDKYQQAQTSRKIGG
jgi:hypothetical protein